MPAVSVGNSWRSDDKFPTPGVMGVLPAEGGQGSRQIGQSPICFCDYFCSVVIWPGIIRWQERWEDSRTVLRFTGLVCVHTTAGKTSSTSAFLFIPARVPAIRRFSLDLSLFGGFRKEAAGIRRVHVTVEERDVEVKRVSRGTWGHSCVS